MQGKVDVFALHKDCSLVLLWISLWTPCPHRSLNNTDANAPSFNNLQLFIHVKVVGLSMAGKRSVTLIEGDW